MRTLPVFLLALMLSKITWAQTAQKTGPQWDGIEFSGLVDGYYSYNHNDPSPALNQLYAFDDKSDQWELNLLKAVASRDPDPIGFRVDLGFGRAMEIMHTPAPDPSFFNYVEQAYVSVKPKGGHGFEADLGEFVTSAGAEVIETINDWNYSRSLLFTLAIPYYHFGIRASLPIGSSLSVGAQLVNGWNEIVDTHGNNMQTAGATISVTRKKFTWSNTYYTGPQYTNSVTTGNRALYDTVVLLTPSEKLNAYVNFDYGRQQGADTNHWEGVAVAARYQISRRFAVSPRAEYYDDATGFTTGTPQHLHEVTLTGEYKPINGLLARVEYRHDGSNAPYFTRGMQSAVSRTQSTVSVGLIAYFPVGH